MLQFLQAREVLMRAAKKCALVAPLVLGGALSIAGCASGHGYVYVRSAPPEPVVEVVTVSPSAGYVWIPGYYRWDDGRYYWVRGRWEHAPRGRVVWVPGRWAHNRHGWYWVNGRWR
jgi:hypothetical protein